MPPFEKQRMLETRFGDAASRGKLDALYKALSQTRVEHANASVEQDKATIPEILQSQQGGLQSQQGGVQQTNIRVNEYLRQWFPSVILNHLAVERTARLMEGTTATAVVTMNYAGTASRVANFFHQSGELNLALQIHEEAAEIYRDMFGTSHPLFGAACENMGTVLHQQGKYEDALRVHKVALEIRIASNDDQGAATSFHEMGSVFSDMGKYTEAALFYSSALATQEPLGLERAYKTYNNLALVLEKVGRYQEALAYHEKTLPGFIAVDGMHHPNTASSYMNIGSILQALQRYDEALKKFRKARDILEVRVGQDHLTTASLLQQHGGRLLQIGTV